MSTENLPRVLCVDDEPNLLKAIERSLRKHCHLRTAASGAEGLRVLSEHGPFEVVVSDMRMPRMNGAEFLRHVREEAPDTVRLLLTAFAELETVVTAVNEGYIYRFLAKPCSARELLSAIQDGVRQHRLITAERVLLEQTLRGCVKALSEVLALAAPEAFGRATRICQIAMLLARQIHYPDIWEIEVAAMLSQLASITLPHETAVKLYHGGDLDAVEQSMVGRMPGVTRQILGGIPRIDGVLAILQWQDVDFAPENPDPDRPGGEDLPLGARILRAASVLEQMQAAGASPRRCLEILRHRKGVCDPRVLDAYETVCEDGAMDFRVRGVSLRELRRGWVLAEDVVSSHGVLLVPAGQTITVGLLERIRNFGHATTLKEPIWVRVVADAGEPDASTPPEEPLTVPE